MTRILAAVPIAVLSVAVSLILAPLVLLTGGRGIISRGAGI